MPRLLALLIIAALRLPAPALAQITSTEYAARRDSLARRLGDGLVVAFGAREPVTDDGTFRQLPSFKYLTGFDEPDAAFVMLVAGGRPMMTTLFAPAKDPRMQLYTGFLPDSAELVQRIGIGLRSMNALQPLVDLFISQGVPVVYVPDVASRDYLTSDTLTRGTRFIAQLKAAHPALKLRNAQTTLDSLRVRKSPDEIVLLRKAIEVSLAGQAAAIRAIAPGKSEAVVQAAAEYTFRTLGDGPAYGSIAGSGPNSTSYHYRANNRVMQAGDVVVMDMGASVAGYAGDLTRTAPVSGTFTADQRAIYQIVRDAQAAAEREVKPGAAVKAGDDAVRAVEAAGLAKLGLIESDTATFDPPWTKDCSSKPLSCRQVFLYMAHGLGHGIGLEVHDAGGYSYSPTGRFTEGEVFTIEPGIYISTKLLDMLPDTPRNRAFIAAVRPAVQRFNNIGVRIEDNYLVTATGYEWLSKGPREASEIEALMKTKPTP